MTRSMKSVWLLGAALLATLGLQATRAEACTYDCKQVPGAPLFCRQCVDTGVSTNVTCANSGPCGCYYVQHYCDEGEAAATTPEALKKAIFSAPEANASTEVPAFDLESLRFAQ